METITPTETVQRFAVLTSRLEEFRAAFDKLARRGARYGCPSIRCEIVGEGIEYQYIEDLSGRLQSLEVAVTYVAVNGEAPRVGDYEFLAKLELAVEGIYVDTVPGVEDLALRFRDSDGSCEHCWQSRRRKHLYVIRELSTGRQLQVGRSCLRDFLGLDSPASIARRFAQWAELRGLGGAYDREPYCVLNASVLTLAAASIRLHGWASRSAVREAEETGSGPSMATADRVSIALAEDHGTEFERALRREIRENVSESDKVLAQATIDWARSLECPSNEYLHNLAIALGRDTMTNPKRLGLVVSAVSAYQREQERIERAQKEAEESMSCHVGQIGERLRGIPAVVTFNRAVGESEWGETVLVKLEDEDGNKFSWFTSRGSKFQAGTKVTMTGTVKKHVEFRGAAETQLSRVMLKSVE